MPKRICGPHRCQGTLAMRALPGLLLLLGIALAVLLWPREDGTGAPARGGASRASAPAAGALVAPEAGTVEVERSRTPATAGGPDEAGADEGLSEQAPCLALRLLDGRDDQPVPDVAVAIHDMLGGWPYPLFAEARSDADGRVVVALPAGGLFSVRVRGTRDLQDSILRLEPLAEDERREMDVRLQPHVLTAVQVRVLTLDEQPVAGARVEPFDEEGAFRPQITGSDGIAVLEDVHEDGWAPLRAVAEGYAWGFRMIDPDEPILDVYVLPEAVIAGTVVHADGTPASGAAVEFRDDPQRARIYDDGVRIVWSAMTDAAGRYRVGNLPAGVQLLVSAHHQGQVLRRVLEPVAEGEQQLDLQLGAPPELLGRVVDAIGQPVAGIELEAEPVLRLGERGQPLTAVERRSTVTDASGSFRFAGKGMAAGTWRVGTRGALDPQSLRDDASAGGANRWLPTVETVEIPEGATHAEVLLRLRDGLYIEGTFFDPEGAPVTRGFVRAYPQEGTRGPRLQTTAFDEQGGFRIGPLAPGTYLVRAGDPVRAIGAEESAVEAGARGLVLRATLPRGVRGRIVDADGRPAQARLYAFDRRRVDSTMWAMRVDGDGRFALYDEEAERIDFFAFRADGVTGLASAVRLTDDGSEEIEIRLAPAASVSIGVRGIEEESWYAVARLDGQVIGLLDPYFLENLMWLPEGLLQLEIREGDRVLASTEARLVLGDPTMEIVLRVPEQSASDD